jgi:Ankyrin repeats (3 copies)/Ankyrin repeat
MKINKPLATLFGLLITFNTYSMDFKIINYCLFSAYFGCWIESYVRSGDTEMVEWLLNNGCDFNFYSAVQSGHVEMVQLLIDYGANVNAQCSEGWTPLHNAAFQGYDKIVQVLINHNANVDTQCNRNWTPMHNAAFQDYDKVVQVLVNSNANVNSKDLYGRTPLHRAVSCNKIKAVHCLLKNGADSNARDGYGQTPLTCTACKNVAHMLINSGADVNAQDENAQSIIGKARRRGYNEVVRFLEYYNSLEQEIRAHFPIDLLRKVIEENFVCLVKLFIHRGFILTQEDLDFAKKHKSKEVGCLINTYLRLTKPNFGSAKKSDHISLPQDLLRYIASYAF